MWAETEAPSLMFSNGVQTLISSWMPNKYQTLHKRNVSVYSSEAGIELAKKFGKMSQRNPNELFGQPTVIIPI